jgi:UDP-N-acetylglucosamine 2-epimerase (non-hydrolysing)
MKANLVVMFVFGTRPEAIKLAPVISRFRAHSAFKVVVCVTAQHREMLDQVLTLFRIVPDVDLNIMRPGQSLTEITCSILTELSQVYKKWRPDFVFVHGDTTTAFAGSLAAFYEKIKIAHVEAGLRTGNLASPWPEEGNRQLISRLTSIHFAPTDSSRKNLLGEGICSERVCVTGNTVIDALLDTCRLLDDNHGLRVELDEKFKFLNRARRLILVTAHRRENFGDGMVSIFKALNAISTKHDDIDIVFPVHLNPSVKGLATRMLGNSPSVYLCEPLEYLSFVYLMRRAHIILSDSGGIQEEAPTLGKPVLVMRETTERPEAVEAGTVRLVGSNETTICREVDILLNSASDYSAMASATNPYGDGRASDRILEFFK